MAARIHRGRCQTLVAREVAIGVDVIRVVCVFDGVVGRRRQRLRAFRQPRIGDMRPFGGGKIFTLLNTRAKSKSCGVLNRIAVGERVRKKGGNGICRTLRDKGRTCALDNKVLIESRGLTYNGAMTLEAWAIRSFGYHFCA